MAKSNSKKFEGEEIKGVTKPALRRVAETDWNDPESVAWLKGYACILFGQMIRPRPQHDDVDADNRARDAVVSILCKASPADNHARVESLVASATERDIAMVSVPAKCLHALLRKWREAMDKTPYNVETGVIGDCIDDVNNLLSTLTSSPK